MSTSCIMYYCKKRNGRIIRTGTGLQVILDTNKSLTKIKDDLFDDTRTKHYYFAVDDSNDFIDNENETKLSKILRNQDEMKNVFWISLYE